VSVSAKIPLKIGELAVNAINKGDKMCN